MLQRSVKNIPDRYDNSYFKKIHGVFVTFAMRQALSAGRV